MYLSTLVQILIITIYTSSSSLIDEMLPLGVYWPGEYLYKFANKSINWPKVEQDLTQLQFYNVNSVWLTHLYPGETAEFARRADKKGIKIVAAIGTIAGEIPGVRNGNHKSIIEQTLRSWGTAPEPLAFGLADEPRVHYMNEMKNYVDSWRKHAPTKSLTSVIMYRDLDSARILNLSATACDVYPFFSAGNKNAYAGHLSLAYTGITRFVTQLIKTPWMMGQAFQFPVGPYEFDSTGNLIYLPGGAPFWVMPNPLEIKWQTFAAIAEGAKGMFYFAYQWSRYANRNASASDLPARVSVRTNSNAPMGLTYPGGAPTEQLKAAGEAFGWVKKHSVLLRKLIKGSQNDATITYYIGVSQIPRRAQVARVFEDCETGFRYLMLVSAYMNQSIGNQINVRLAPYMESLLDIDTFAETNVSASKVMNFYLKLSEAKLYKITWKNESLLSPSKCSLRDTNANDTLEEIDQYTNGTDPHDILKNEDPDTKTPDENENEFPSSNIEEFADYYIPIIAGSLAGGFVIGAIAFVWIRRRRNHQIKANTIMLTNPTTKNVAF
jgi:hypothetical protein